MKDDIWKHCKTCKHNHTVGELRVDSQGVPLYGARKCQAWIKYSPKRRRRCNCDKFVEDMALLRREQKKRERAALPSVKGMTQSQVAKMFAETGFMSPQTELQARVAAHKLLQLPRGNKRERQFMIAVLGSTYDTRGALLRTDSKFANLVAQTDYILHAMERVGQLAEQLTTIADTQQRILEILDEQTQPGQQVMGRRLLDHVNVFSQKSAPLLNEVIPTESEPTDD